MYAWPRACMAARLFCLALSIYHPFERLPGERNDARGCHYFDLATKKPAESGHKMCFAGNWLKNPSNKPSKCAHNL
jgi:hypothetical protein